MVTRCPPSEGELRFGHTRRTVQPMSQRSASEPAGAMYIQRRTIDGTVVLAVSGVVDLETSPQLRDGILAALTLEAESCVVDLTRVSFLDSSGLSALLDATRHGERRHEPLRIVVDANRPVVRPIEITGLDSVLRLYDSVDQALRIERSG